MRERLLTGTYALAASIAILGAGSATAAASVATTGSATQVTSTSAVLNGTAAPTDTAPGDSAWAFEYGTSTSYGLRTKTVVIGGGNAAVSVKVTGLTPNTVYHFQLVVAQNVNYSPSYSLGGDATFKTSAQGSGSGGKGGTKNGRAGLKSHRLKVKSGYVSVPFHCSGSTGSKCKGAVIIAATGKLGKAKKRMYGCAGGSFSTTAGKTSTLHLKLSKSCKTLLRQARNHQLKATLRATYSTHQPSLKTGITLVG